MRERERQRERDTERETDRPREGGGGAIEKSDRGRDGREGKGQTRVRE